jgi:ankyrin repeat protein
MESPLVLSQVVVDSLFKSCKTGDVGSLSHTLKRVHDINTIKNIDGTSLLEVSIDFKQLHVMKILFDSNYSALGAEEDLVLRAAKTGDAQCVMHLLSHLLGLNPATLQIPLEYASSHGYIDVARVIVSAAPGLLLDKPLFVACSAGHADIIHLLLNSRADANAVVPMHRGPSTPLGVAADNGHVTTVDLLRSNGATIGRTDSNMLVYASNGGCLSFVQDILREASSTGVDIPGPRIGNALQCSAENGHTEVVKALLDLMMSVQKGNFNIIVMKSYLRALSRGHADIAKALFATNYINKTPTLQALSLLHAVEGGCVDIVAGALANRDQPNEHIFSRASDPNMVKMLLDSKADVHIGSAASVLRSSCSKLQYQSVKMLLEAGVDVKSTDNTGTSASAGAPAKPQKNDVSPLYHAIVAHSNKETMEAQISIINLLIDSGASTYGVSNSKTSLHCCFDMMMNVGFIQNGNNVKTGHKNNNNACVRDMQIEHPVNTLGQTVLSSPIG